ncbi:Pimeloyl-ACP methyl ester carboxylesterase [Frankineae bacterium MT45]|nr:Pimeloyl-ACP methyl ester carboxylesterase [Frankineae bacterium MT45]
MRRVTVAPRGCAKVPVVLAFERSGSGEPLILIHGVGHRRQAWYPVRDLLTPHRDVILVDLPGHGESPPLELNGRSVADALTDYLREFLKDLSLESPHIGGNSLGGRIALEAAVHGDARSATALSPAGFWRSRLEFAYTEKLFNLVSASSRTMGSRVGTLSRTAAGRTMMLSWLNAHPGSVTPEMAVGDFHAFQAAQPALKMVLAGAIEFSGTIPEDVPVTIAWGTRDTVLPVRQLKWAHQLIPSATCIRLPSCGHMPMSDRPRLVADVLLRGSAPV